MTQNNELKNYKIIESNLIQSNKIKIHVIRSNWLHFLIRTSGNRSNCLRALASILSYLIINSTNNLFVFMLKMQANVIIFNLVQQLLA